MKLHIYRFLGIVTAGTTMFFLIIMAAQCEWNEFFRIYLPDNYPLFLGFDLALLATALFLSLENMEGSNN